MSATGSERSATNGGLVVEESARLNQTIDALLLLSKAERTAPTDAQPVFILRNLVDEVVSLLEVLGEERGILISQQYPELAAVEVLRERLEQASSKTSRDLQLTEMRHVLNDAHKHIVAVSKALQKPAR